VALAVLLTSLVFTLLHFDLDQPWLFTANVFLFSAFACLWALETGNVWGVMGWHAAWNWLFATGFELRVTSLDAHMPALLVKMTPIRTRHLTGGGERCERSLVCSLVLVGGCAFLLARHRSGRKKSVIASCSGRRKDQRAPRATTDPTPSRS